MPKLSIIVPVYNVEQYVCECLDSIELQTLSDYEVIVVDDGSTDGSGTIVDGYADRFPKFKVIHKTNGGLMSAWMRGVQESAGEMIGFVDSDDFVNVKTFEHLVSVMEKTNADIVMCDYIPITPDASMYDAVEICESEIHVYQGSDVERVKTRALPYPGCDSVSMARWNKIFKRELLMSNLKYCECLSKTFEDRYIVPACVYSVSTFAKIDKPLYYYRHREGSNSGMYKHDLLAQIHRMYGVQRQVLEDKGLFDAYGECWEKAFLDYMRLFVARNVVGASGFDKRLNSCKELLRDETARARMLQFGALLDGKQGAALRFAFRFDSSVLLAMSSYFA